MKFHNTTDQSFDVDQLMLIIKVSCEPVIYLWVLYNVQPYCKYSGNMMCTVKVYN